ncbi:ABC transporter permease [Aureibacter tunicatorum]|nr:ABC transporter permease [Aureibacter tunicatorum]
MAIGLASIMFSYLFFKNEMSYDAFHDNGENIYRSHPVSFDDKNAYYSGFYYPGGEVLKGEIPEVEQMLRLSTSQAPLYIDRQKLTAQLMLSDPNIFDFFSFKLVQGNEKEVLKGKHSAVVTESFALSNFGSIDNSIGKSFEYMHQTFSITGVAEDPPGNTHLNFEVVIPIKFFGEHPSVYVGWKGGYTPITFLSLASNADISQVEDKATQIFQKYSDQDKEHSIVKLQRISDIHTSEYVLFDFHGKRNIESILTILTVSLVIFLLATLNFTVLYVAQKDENTKNIALLKLYGAKPKDISLLTFIETLIIIVISALIGLGLLYGETVLVNNWLGIQLAISDYSWFELIIGFGLLVSLGIVVSLLTLRKMISQSLISKTQSALLSKRKSSNQGRLMLGGQFFIMLVLMSTSGVVYFQHQYMLEKSLGYKTDNFLTIESEDNLPADKFASLKSKLLSMSEIESVTLTSQRLGSGLTSNGYKIGHSIDFKILNTIYVDESFIDCMGIEILEGDDFSKHMEANQDKILINQRLTELEGWKNILETKIHRNGISYDVIGVTDNFHFASVMNAIDPVIINPNPQNDGWNYSCLNVRANTDDLFSLRRKLKDAWTESFPENNSEVLFTEDYLQAQYNDISNLNQVNLLACAVSIILGLMGLWGITMFTVRKRYREIAIRKINGASVSDIFKLILADYMRWVGVAVILALPLVYYIAVYWLNGFPYRIALPHGLFVVNIFSVLLLATLTIIAQSWSAANQKSIETLRGL